MEDDRPYCIYLRKSREDREIEKYENVSYKEAIKIVGNSVGILTTEIKIENNKNQVYYDMYDLANKFYQNNLFFHALLRDTY